MRVCIISEGSYPLVRGGLSEWAHLLIKTLEDVEFDVFSIAPTGEEEQLYEKLPNLNKIVIVPLIRSNVPKGSPPLPKALSRNLASFLRNALCGKSIDFDTINKAQWLHLVNKEWLNSRRYWDLIVDFYQVHYPEYPFTEYFWTVFSLCSILLDSIYSTYQLPKADVYHSLNVGIGGFVGALAKALYGTPLIITDQGQYIKEVHDYLSRHDMPQIQRHQLIKFCESMVKTSYKYADWVVPPCHSHIPIEREMGADPDKIRVINNGIDCDRFRPGPPRNGRQPMIGCFARVVPIKGITTLIRAARTVVNKHQANFVVVGEVQDKEYYRQCQGLVDELGLRDNFRFIGHADALEWYHRVDVSVLPSLSEGVPYALLESMSCGLPCVCTAVGGVPEIISTDVGYTVPPNDADSLSERICELLENEGLRKRLSQRATEVANEKYTIGEMASEFRGLYEGVSNGSSRI